MLSNLLRLAVDLEWIERNPIIDLPPLKGGEYEPWPESKLRAYERYCDEHNCDDARTIYELVLGTGQRLGDCCAMQWDDFDNGYVAVVQEKTKTKLWIFCPQRLQEYLARLPKRGRFIMAKNLTEGLTKRAVQRFVEDVRKGIGVMHCDDRLVLHGWRYSAAVE